MKSVNVNISKLGNVELTTYNVKYNKRCNIVFRVRYMYDNKNMSMLCEEDVSISQLVKDIVNFNGEL
jgi:hypothetical protein